MYEYMIVNEHSGERLSYRETLQEAKDYAEKEAPRWGSQRISVWKRACTFEAERNWK